MGRNKEKEEELVTKEKLERVNNLQKERTHSTSPKVNMKAGEEVKRKPAENFLQKEEMEKEENKEMRKIKVEGDKALKSQDVFSCGARDEKIENNKVRKGEYIITFRRTQKKEEIKEDGKKPEKEAEVDILKQTIEKEHRKRK